VRAAALDLNGDNWIDGDERRMARNAGFQNFDANGDLFVSADEMNACLRGGSSAFRWLSGANPAHASAQPAAGSGGMTAPSESYAPSATASASYESHDRGAAFDTPAPIAHDAAMRYLQSKVDADPSYQPRIMTESPDLMQIEPASGPVIAPEPLTDFNSLDLNGDGVVTSDEYQAYRAGLSY
jgi:hypothetical protein